MPLNVLFSILATTARIEEWTVDRVTSIGPQSSAYAKVCRTEDAIFVEIAGDLRICHRNGKVSIFRSSRKEGLSIVSSKQRGFELGDDFQLRAVRNLFPLWPTLFSEAQGEEDFRSMLDYLKGSGFLKGYIKGPSKNSKVQEVSFSSTLTALVLVDTQCAWLVRLGNDLPHNAKFRWGKDLSSSISYRSMEPEILASLPDYARGEESGMAEIKDDGTLLKAGSLKTSAEALSWLDNQYSWVWQTKSGQAVP